jgi:RHS repeat-associated protein
MSNNNCLAARGTPFSNVWYFMPAFATLDRFHAINYVYDDLYRLTQKTYPDSTSVEYVYDLVGKLLSVTDPTGTYGFAYDNMGRLVGTTTQYAFLSGNYTTSYTYDANSNRLTMTDPQSGVTNYTYDTLNRLSTLTPPTAFSSTGFGFTYDALSRRTQMTRPNGVTTNYSYDNLSRLLSVLHQIGTSTIDGNVYTYDSAGNRLTNTNEQSAVTSNYTFDPLYELTQVTQATNTTESYSYDPVGNRLTSLGVSPYSNNTSNELTSTPTASYSYDYNGNLTSKTISGSTTQYTWDFENHLTSVVLPGTGGTVTFKYDGFGRRVQKAFTQNSNTTTTNYLYDGGNPIEDVDQNGNVLARYEQTANIDEPIVELRSGTTSYYQADGLGSVTSLTSSAGAVANTYTYDSFGNLSASTGSITNRFQYTGREFDPETAIYYYRARYYDPSAGRFISEDPIRFRGGNNFYAYVHNRPTLLRDPSGRVCWGGGLSGAGALGAFWFGAGVEGSFYLVGDSSGNQGILDCSGGGVGAMSGAGGSISLQGSSLISPNCGSICDLQGDFGGFTGFGGAGLTGSVSGGASLSKTTVTFTGSGGLGVGGGYGVVGVWGNCILIAKHHNCPSCPVLKH